MVSLTYDPNGRAVCGGRRLLMIRFKQVRSGEVDLAQLMEERRNFTLNEWIELLLNT